MDYIQQKCLGLDNFPLLKDVLIDKFCDTTNTPDENYYIINKLKEIWTSQTQKPLK